jgi:hypothetical protein
MEPLWHTNQEDIRRRRRRRRRRRCASANASAKYPQANQAQ